MRFWLGSVGVAAVALGLACVPGAITKARTAAAGAPQALHAASPPPPAQEPPAPPPLLVPPGIASPAEAPPDAAAEAPAPRWRFRHPVVPRSETRVAVLMYHSIDTIVRLRSVHPLVFAAQLRWIVEQGIEIVPMRAFLDFLDGLSELPRHAVVLTMDDSERVVYTRAFPFLKEHQAPFTLALVTEPIVYTRAAPHVLSWGEVRAMIDSGLCDVAAHGHVHRDLVPLHDGHVRYQLERSRALIEEHTGVRPLTFVYPEGNYDRRVVELTEEAGYRAAFTAWGKAAEASSPRFYLPRIAVNRGTPLELFLRRYLELPRPAAR